MSETKIKPFPENKVLKNWVEDLGGPVRVAEKFGVDESTLWRWTVGELETPSWVFEFIKISEINASRRQEITRQGREIDKLKAQLRRQELEIHDLKNELKN